VYDLVELCLPECVVGMAMKLGMGRKQRDAFHDHRCMELKRDCLLWSIGLSFESRNDIPASESLRAIEARASVDPLEHSL
jgi:hypothetical protein